MSVSRSLTLGSLGIAFASAVALGVMLDVRGELAGLPLVLVVAALVALAYAAVHVQRAMKECERVVVAADRVHAQQLSKMSHELRTPLNAIVGWTEILKFDNGENHGRAIEAIERNAFAQAHLIDEALSAANVKPGPVPVRTASPPLDLRILVVEDDEDSATTLQRLLSDRGCDVRVARSVHECLELCREAAPDVLLCDIGLPDGDGYGLLRALRATAPMLDVPAIAMSALARDEDRARAARVGFADYLTKPYHVDDLVDHIRRAVSAQPLHAPGLDR